MEKIYIGKKKEDQDYANTVAASNLLSTSFVTVMHTGLGDKLCIITSKFHVMTMFFSLFLQNPHFALCLLLGIMIITSMNISSILLLKLGSPGTVFKLPYIHPYQWVIFLAFVLYYYYYMYTYFMHLNF